MSVLFPAPDGPMSAHIPTACVVAVTPRRVRLPPSATPSSFPAPERALVVPDSDALAAGEVEDGVDDVGQLRLLDNIERSRSDEDRHAS